MFMKKTHSFILFLAILIVSLGVRFYWESQKSAFHVDEVMSFVLCDYGDLGWTITFSGEYTGAEAKQAMLFPHPSLDDAIQDIRHNWQDNRDHYHTNFYYTILRLWLVGFQSYHIHDIIVHCLWINYIFYVAYFILLYFFLRLFFRERPKILFLGLLLIGLSASDIANTIFIREYMLQELGALFLAYIVVKSVIEIKKDAYRYNIKNFLITSFAIWAIIFNGYFQFVYVGVLGLYLVWVLCQKKDYYKIIYFAGTMFAAVALCYVCYQGFFKILTEDNKVSGGLSARTLSGYFSPFLFYSLFVMHYTLYIPYLFIIGYVWRKKRMAINQVPWIFIAAVIYSVAAFWTAPMRTNRYIVSATPLLLLIVPFAISKLQGKQQKIASVLCILTAVVMMCFKGNIENMNFDKDEKANLLNNHSEMPTYIVVNKKQPWTQCDIIPYLNNHRHYIFVNSVEEIKCNQPHIVSIDCFRCEYPVEKMKQQWEYKGYGSFYNHYIVK